MRSIGIDKMPSTAASNLVGEHSYSRPSRWNTTAARPVDDDLLAAERLKVTGFGW